VGCLNLYEIYSFLEDDISPSERKKINNHLSICPKCCRVLEERKFLNKALEGMPSWKTPPGFTQMVMERIFPARVSLWKTMAVLSMGFISFFSLFIVYLRLTGQNISYVFFSLVHNLKEQIKGICLVFIKFLKLTAFFLKMLGQVGELALKGILQVATFIDTETQILIVSVIILIVSFIYGMGRKLLTGEK